MLWCCIRHLLRNCMWLFRRMVLSYTSSHGQRTAKWCCQKGYSVASLRYCLLFNNPRKKYLFAFCFFVVKNVLAHYALFLMSKRCLKAYSCDCHKINRSISDAWGTNVRESKYLPNSLWSYFPAFSMEKIEFCWPYLSLVICTEMLSVVILTIFVNFSPKSWEKWVNWSD